MCTELTHINSSLLILFHLHWLSSIILHKNGRSGAGKAVFWTTGLDTERDCAGALKSCLVIRKGQFHIDITGQYPSFSPAAYRNDSST